MLGSGALQASWQNQRITDTERAILGKSGGQRVFVTALSKRPAQFPFLVRTVNRRVLESNLTALIDSLRHCLWKPLPNKRYVSVERLSKRQCEISSRSYVCTNIFPVSTVHWLTRARYAIIVSKPKRIVHGSDEQWIFKSSLWPVRYLLCPWANDKYTGWSSVPVSRVRLEGLALGHLLATTSFFN